jgi:hypothetical protein
VSVLLQPWLLSFLRNIRERVIAVNAEAWLPLHGGNGDIR